MTLGKAPATAFSNPGRTSLVEGEVTDREIPVQQRRRLVPTKSTWATPVTATLAAIAVAAAAAFGGNQILNTQSGGSGPIDATSSSANFGDGNTVVVDDPAIASQGEGAGPRAVKEFRQDDPFSMFALTWQGQKDVAAFVRAEQEDGSWGEWFSAEPMDVTTEGTNGTDLIFVGDTNAVQVSVGNVDLGIPSDQEVEEELDSNEDAQDAPADDSAPAPAEAQVEAPAQEDSASDKAESGETDEGVAETAQRVGQQVSAGVAPKPSDIGKIKPVADSEELPAESGAVSASELEAVFINGNAQEDGIANMADTDGMPPVVTSAGWGANESNRCSNPDYTEPTKALTLHHTAGSNNYTPAQAAGQVRGIFQYHAQTLGWCDMGYNVLVDKYGTIYEGRYGGLERGVMGAHVGGFNSNTWGISMIGNYETAQPSSEILNSVTSIAAWKAAQAGFDPSGTVSLRSGGFSNARYAAGTTATVPTFHGHSDLHYTACPGGYVISRWDEIRNATKTKYDAIASGDAIDQPSTGDDSAPVLGENGGDASSEQAGTNDLASVLPGLSSIAERGANQQGSSDFSDEEIQAVTAVAAAVAGLAITAGAVTLPESGGEVAPGVSADALPGIISQVLAIAGNEEATAAFDSILNIFGPILGAPVGGPDSENAQLVYQLFNNGVVLSSEDTGTHALIGEFARAWAQGDTAAQLGLPTTDQYAVGGEAGGNSVRVDFQGGYITYDPNTATVDVHTN
ncbi:N-acetylmuramoyl-L-alanine amidase [Corynebacterium stationis]|uniref:N-acetylmuramoyl-L-alanine amidase n=2 Tax=Corynebacterium stationis TaxID=1705 RepID=UPI00241EE67B|nr:N-acetylmuramoyl-L-alanine amidase [Corynebacterium stationis]